MNQSNAHNSSIVIAILLICIILMGLYIGADAVGIINNKDVQPPVEPSEPVEDNPPVVITDDITDKGYLAFLDDYLTPLAAIAYGYNGETISVDFASLVIMNRLCTLDYGVDSVYPADFIRTMAAQYFASIEDTAENATFDLSRSVTYGAVTFESRPTRVDDVITSYRLCAEKSYAEPMFTRLVRSEAIKDDDNTAVTYSYYQNTALIGTVTIVLNADNAVTSVSTLAAN